MFEDLKHRIANMLARVVIKAVSENEGLRKVTVSMLADEVKDGVEVFENYAFTARPLPGAEGLAVFPGGSRDVAFVVAVGDRRHRPRDLQPGEAAMHDDQMQHVRIYRDRIEVSGKDLVKVVAPKVVVESADIHLGGEEGGKRVARIGDKVQVGAGSSQGEWPIVTGSSSVRAAGLSEGD
ncbi:phage baseplate assembly protein V [Pyruvatibacter sp.]